MTENVQDLLNELAEKPPRSKLEPYRDFIRELRIKRWPYRDIAALFQEKFQIHVAPSTLHNFVKVRAKQTGVMAIPSPNRAARDANGTTTRQPQARGTKPRFDFVPGETLKLSPKERKK